MGNADEHHLLLALTALLALAAGCLLGLPGGGGTWARVISGTVSGLLTLAAYAGIVWLLPHPRLWVLLPVLLGKPAPQGVFIR